MEIPPRPRGLELFGFLLQVVQVVVQGGDEAVGPIWTDNAQSHAVATRAHVCEQHGERAQPSPTDSRVVDPQDGGCNGFHSFQRAMKRKLWTSEDSREYEVHIQSK